MPFPGVRDVLCNLKDRGYQLYVLSSNSIENIRYFLKQHDMNVFAGITTSPGLFGKHRTLAKLLHRNQISRQEALYVGDELRDINACRTTGIRVLSVTWGYDSASLLASGKPDFLASSPSEITEILPGPPG